VIAPIFVLKTVHYKKNFRNKELAVVALDDVIEQTNKISQAVLDFKQQHFYGSRLNRASGKQDPLGSGRRKVAAVFHRK